MGNNWKINRLERTFYSTRVLIANCIMAHGEEAGMAGMAGMAPSRVSVSFLVTVIVIVLE